MKKLLENESKITDKDESIKWALLALILFLIKIWYDTH